MKKKREREKHPRGGKSAGGITSRRVSNYVDRRAESLKLRISLGGHEPPLGFFLLLPSSLSSASSRSADEQQQKKMKGEGGGGRNLSQEEQYA